MANTPSLQLGSALPLDGRGTGGPELLPAHHLVTHGVIVGMTGSGKTGLVMVTAEEALRAGIPVLAIDVKGDLPNLLLAFPSFDPAAFVPFVDASVTPVEGEVSKDTRAAELAAARKSGLSGWGIDEGAVASFAQTTSVRVITPGSSAGESLHLLSSLERRSPRWDDDRESARAALSAAVSLVLRLIGRDSDPARSREHVLLSVLAERRLLRGESAELSLLLHDLAEPPIAEIGALSLDAFLPKSERRSLAAAVNTLLASPTFATWREGATIDIEDWLTPKDGKTPAVIVSVAHLDDDERALVLGVLLEEVLAWVRGLPGTQRLRALVMFDEVYGFLPPHTP